jgi:hypothetical protein
MFAKPCETPRQHGSRKRDKDRTAPRLRKDVVPKLRRVTLEEHPPMKTRPPPTWLRDDPGDLVRL